MYWILHRFTAEMVIESGIQSRSHKSLGQEIQSSELRQTRRPDKFLSECHKLACGGNDMLFRVRFFGKGIPT